MNGPESSLNAAAADAHIRRVEQSVTVRRRFRSRMVLLIGAVTVAYFAVMGAVTDGRSEPLSMIMTVFPVIAVLALASIWGKHRGLESRRLVNLEYRLAGMFAVLVCVAGVLATVLAHPWPAALAGILPAAVCLLGAWQLSHR
ncbi:MAG: hypothetical protein M3Y35_04790 [Actinomycetota bacterium]|nr:hypothetical protein [Actinomycetota bacterium]